jgi:predicted ATP-dependent serine protease
MLLSISEGRNATDNPYWEVCVVALNLMMEFSMKINGNYTTILSHETPDYLKQRIMTGVNFVDDLIGGLTPSTVIMLTGTPGAGKSTLMMQIATSLARKCIVLYNSGEESKDQLRSRFDRFTKESDFLLYNEKDINSLLKLANNIIRDNPGKRIVLIQDSIQSFKNCTMQCVEQLTSWAKSTHNIVMFISQVNKGGRFSGVNGILHEIDVETSITLDKAGERSFNVMKHRFGNGHSSVGIVMENAGLRMSECSATDNVEVNNDCKSNEVENVVNEVCGKYCNRGQRKLLQYLENVKVARLEDFPHTELRLQISSIYTYPQSMVNKGLISKEYGFYKLNDVVI